LPATRSAPPRSIFTRAANPAGLKLFAVNPAQGPAVVKVSHPANPTEILKTQVIVLQILQIGIVARPSLFEFQGRFQILGPVL
jgi:hypothetical protein